MDREPLGGTSWRGGKSEKGLAHREEGSGVMCQPRRSNCAGSGCLTSVLRPLLLPFLPLPHTSRATFLSLYHSFSCFLFRFPPSSPDFPVNRLLEDASPVDITHFGFLLKLDPAGALEPACPALAYHCPLPMPLLQAGLAGVFSKSLCLASQRKHYETRVSAGD